MKDLKSVFYKRNSLKVMVAILACGVTEVLTQRSSKEASIMRGLR